MFPVNTKSFPSRRDVTGGMVMLVAAGNRDWGNETDVWKSRIKGVMGDEEIRPCDVICHRCYQGRAEIKIALSSVSLTE